MSETEGTVSVDQQGRVGQVDAGYSVGKGEQKAEMTFGDFGGISSGKPGEVAPTKFWGIRGVGMDRDGSLYVAMSEMGTILRKFSPDGRLAWELFGHFFVDLACADPASDGGNYAEVSMVSTTVANVVMEVHFSMLRGGTGFYVTPIFIHRNVDGAFSMGECRDNIYAGSIFNWMKQ